MVSAVNGVFSITIDYSIGLRKMVKRAVDERYLYNINPNITSKNFKLSRSGVWEVDLEIVPCFNDWEPKEKAAKRLALCGCVLENIGELAALAADKPDEVAKYEVIFAMGFDSRWMDADKYIRVPGVSAGEKTRHFGLYRFDRPLFANCGILVSRRAVPVASNLEMLDLKL